MRMIGSKQRVLAAAEHRGTDRMPITFDAEKEVYDILYKHIGKRDRAALFDTLHCDTWMVLPKNYLVPSSQEGKERQTSIWGWQTQTAYYSGGSYGELCYSPLADKEELSDIDKHPWPDPSVQDFSHFRSEIASQKDRAIISASSWGAYFIASFIRGMEGILMDFVINQEYAEKLINTIAERLLAFLENMLNSPGAEGIDIVYMADDYCSQRAPLFSPGIFKRFVVPYLSKVAELSHKRGKKFLLHVCGAVRPLLPMIIDCGVDMLEPIQIRAEGMDPEGLKRDFGRHICFYGGIDLQQVLCRGNPQTVCDEVRRMVDILGRDGGYIVGPGHTYIQVDAPLENILAMYKTAYEYRPFSK
jgi:uroporphyrinogen decarboxylase